MYVYMYMSVYGHVCTYTCSNTYLSFQLFTDTYILVNSNNKMQSSEQYKNKRPPH